MKKIQLVEKYKLAEIKLIEMKARAVENSILNEDNPKILKELIVEGINIGLELSLKSNNIRNLFHSLSPEERLEMMNEYDSNTGFHESEMV